MNMQAQIVKRTPLPGVPSASALETSADVLIIIGDDSPDLFFVNQHGRRVGQVALYEPAQLEEGRIPKQVKLDLETTFLVEETARSQLYVMGSGSKGHRRDHGFRVTLPWGTATPAVTAEMLEGVKVEKLSLEPLYEALREREELARFARKSSVLNLEGSVATAKRIVFLQRDKQGEGNSVITFSREDYLSWARGASGELPAAEIYPCRLPRISEAPSGFSGAWCSQHTTARGEELIFSASAESGADPVEDGVTAGSALGLMTLPFAEAAAPTAPKIEAWMPITQSGRLFRGKVESLAALRSADGGRPDEYFAVTDDDAGGSELLTLRVEW